MRKPLSGARLSLCALASVASAVLVAACGGGTSSGLGFNNGNHGLPAGCRVGGQAEVLASQSFGQRLMSAQPKEKYIRGRILVRFSNAGTEPEVAQAMTRLGAQRTAPASDQGWTALSIAPGSDPVSAAAAMRHTRGVADARPVEARYLLAFPNDPDLGARSQLANPQPTPGSNPVQWDMYDINMDQVWPNWTGSGVTIAVIDTGYDSFNYDVCGRVTNSIVFDNTNGTQDTTASAQDEDGHGTDVIGIAASETNNNLRFAGVTIGANIIVARVFPNPSSGDPSPGAAPLDIAAAINWAVSQHANIISMSLGAPASCAGDPEQAAIQNAINAGVTVVVASGNENLPTLDIPANCDPRIVSVGATGIDDVTNPLAPTETVATYSNGTAANNLTLVAPGGDPCLAAKPPKPNCTPPPVVDYLQWIINAYSTTACPKSECPQNVGPAVGVFIAGTSMATPHVAGVAALLLQKHPAWQPGQIKIALVQSADDICSACPREGSGRLDAAKALQL